ncbi:MAG: type II secretion system protein [Candidatus Paceibacterota bacterium]|jgi:type II secretory pathway component PulJ
MINKIKNSKAFTMVETMVSIALFGFISIVLINVFVSAIKGQTRILQNQELMDQSTYVLEYMAKILRMAQKDTAGDCTGTAGANYGVGINSINFVAYDTMEEDYRCRQFILENDIIKERRSTDESAANLGASQDMTSSKVKVEGLTFGVTGNVVGDLVQPKVTVMVKMESNISLNPPEITVQTSVSQRSLDI